MANILYHRPTDWTSEVQCSTKVLARLTAARGHTTHYLQAPLDPVHLLRGPGGYFKSWKNAPQEENDVNIVIPATPMPVRDVWPLNTLTASQLRYRCSVPSLRQSVGSPDLIWTTVPGSGAVFRDIFPQARVAFHVIDYYPAFRGEAVKALEYSDYMAADTVFTISQTLQDYLVDDLNIPKNKVTVLGQGVEAARYDPNTQVPSMLADLPHPRVVWTGVLGKGDPGLFDAAAQEITAQGGSLVLIGPGAPWADDLKQRYPNTVCLTGAIAPPNLPDWLVHCDIGLLLYDRSKQDVYRGQNPLKLYEYAAAGLPILSTPHDEFLHLAPPVQTVVSESDVVTALRSVQSASEHWRGLSLEFAAQHSWQAKVDTILAQLHIQQIGQPLT